jgi:DNA-binding FrmR family transcriptional regulator
MDIDATAQRDVVNRLRRARGQIDGVIAMMESGRSCRDVVTQLSAASKAIDRAGYKLVVAGMKECLTESDPELSAAELEKLFISLA